MNPEEGPHPSSPFGRCHGAPIFMSWGFTIYFFILFFSMKLSSPATPELSLQPGSGLKTGV
jgi:hypothetical protein